MQGARHAVLQIPRKSCTCNCTEFPNFSKIPKVGNLHACNRNNKPTGTRQCGPWLATACKGETANSNMLAAKTISSTTASKSRFAFMHVSCTELPINEIQTLKPSMFINTVPISTSAESQSEDRLIDNRGSFKDQPMEDVLLNTLGAFYGQWCGHLPCANLLLPHLKLLKTNNSNQTKQSSGVQMGSWNPAMAWWDGSPLC